MRAQAEIGKYASELVHNLNNPLHCVAGALEVAAVVVARPELDRERLAQALKISQTSIDDVKQIVGGILLHARESAAYHLERVDVNAVIRQEIDFFKIDPLFRDHVRVETRLSPTPLTVLGNRIQVKQMLDNIIKNAIDAMEESFEKTLDIRTQAVDSTVLVTIADTGSGIAPEHLDKVMSPDFSTKPPGKGTGLGMASVCTMVKAYSGKIEIDSHLGRGTSVTLTLPAAAQGPGKTI
mgnify:CR=1 FL=1